MKKIRLASAKKIDTYHHGDLRHAIIQAALNILSQKGVHALSLRAAAKQAGVSSAAPYRHFPDKASLLASLAAYGFDSIRAALEIAATQHPGNILNQLLASAIAFIHFSQTHPELHRLMDTLDPEDYPELESSHIKAEETFFNLIKNGQKYKTIVAGDPENLAIVAFAFIHGLSVMLLGKNCHLHGAPQKGLELDEWIRQLCRIVWNGFGRIKLPPLKPAATTRR